MIKNLSFSLILLAIACSGMPQQNEKLLGEIQESVWPIFYKADLNEKAMELDASELRLLRNGIFASKGYLFDSPDLIEHFSQYNWYKPTSKNVVLTQKDSVNIQYLLQREKNRDDEIFVLLSQFHLDEEAIYGSHKFTQIEVSVPNPGDYDGFGPVSIDTEDDFSLEICLNTFGPLKFRFLVDNELKYAQIYIFKNGIVVTDMFSESGQVYSLVYSNKIGLQSNDGWKIGAKIKHHPFIKNMNIPKSGQAVIKVQHECAKPILTIRDSTIVSIMMRPCWG